jgi:hypothetical protein
LVARERIGSGLDATRQVTGEPLTARSI